jgi:hypothetical protein
MLSTIKSSLVFRSMFVQYLKNQVLQSRVANATRAINPLHQVKLFAMQSASRPITADFRAMVANFPEKNNPGS